MIWLVHALLSPPDDEVRLGNLLADLVKGKERKGMSEPFLRGVHLHQQIDVFTDYHPLAYQSRARLAPEFRRIGGILVDVFYGHFFAQQWSEHSPEPLEQFLPRLYGQVGDYRNHLSPMVRGTVHRMIREDWLGSYGHLEGVQRALRRLANLMIFRLGDSLGIEKALAQLTTHYDALREEAAAFFPELKRHLLTCTMKKNEPLLIQRSGSFGPKAL